MSDVAKPAYLDKRKNSSAWYYRRRYPSDIAKRLGRKEFVKSLKTSNYAEALKLLPAAEAAYLASLVGPSTATGIVRHAPWPVRNLDPNLSELTEDMVPALAAQHFERRRHELFLEPISFRRSEEQQQDLAEVEWRLHTLASPDDPDACRWTEAEEVALLNSNGLRADASGPASQMLRRHLWQAMVELEQLRRCRLNGHVANAARQPFDAGRNVAGSWAKVGRDATPLSKVIKLYRDEHLSSDDLAAKTVAKTEAALAIISRYFKANTPVAAIDRDACYAFRDMLAKLPPNFTKKHGSSSDLSKVAQKNAAAGRSGLNKQTQEPYLRTLRRLLALAKDRRFIAENPAEGIKPKGRAVPNEHKRNSYSKAQLAQLFNAPIYTGCQDDERNFAVPGPNKPRRSRFWVPLIALFTGLRLEEILQLTSDHVFNDENGEPYLRITRDMKVKSNNAYRAVPIHSELIKIGFMSLVAEASSREEDHLLVVDVPHASDKTRSSVFSKRYSTFQKSLKIDEPGRKVTFHSFRHTFRDALRLPDANPDLVRELGGWSRGSETSTAYGDGARPEVLRTLVERINYCLDLSHLHPSD